MIERSVAMRTWIARSRWLSARVPGGLADYLTIIQPDGSWRTDITTGGTDTNATRVAALLVSADFSYPCVQGECRLSTNLLLQALARAIMRLPSPGQRWTTSSPTGPSRFAACHWPAMKSCP